jgi:hypothetical protein
LMLVLPWSLPPREPTQLGLTGQLSARALRHLPSKGRVKAVRPSNDRLLQLIGDHSLVGVDGQVLYGDLLLSPPPLVIESLGQH